MVEARGVETARRERSPVAKERLTALAGLARGAGGVGVDGKREQRDRSHCEDKSGNALHVRFSYMGDWGHRRSGPTTTTSRRYDRLPTTQTDHRGPNGHINRQGEDQRGPPWQLP